MAKLYWRVKKEGKWTWVAACEGNTVWRSGGTLQEAIYLEDNPIIIPEE